MEEKENRGKRNPYTRVARESTGYSGENGDKTRQRAEQQKRQFQLHSAAYLLLQ